MNIEVSGHMCASHLARRTEFCLFEQIFRSNHWRIQDQKLRV